MPLTGSLVFPIKRTGREKTESLVLAEVPLHRRLIDPGAFLWSHAQSATLHGERITEPPDGGPEADRTEEFRLYHHFPRLLTADALIDLSGFDTASYRSK